MHHQRLNPDGKTLESRRSDEEHTTGVGPAASRCLSEDEVMRLCAGEISEEHLGRMDEHLDRCEACQRWVAEVMAHGATNPALDEASTYPTAFRTGTMAAGRFRVVRFIKRGGMGEVYEAFDSVLETRVALKTIISTACDSPRAVRKLKAEVQLARSIRHPNVCSVFDIWEHHPAQGDGSPVYFFTMEFIDGLSLRQVLERSLFELGETLRIARLELLGLRAAHDAGVVHRDFKSDNVMLRSDRQDDGQVVVMDFGLARTLQKDPGASADSEQFAGSVAYMAPEQVEGKRQIGPEADVFAFGVVLFEMLTGELPWVGDSPWTTAALRLTQRAPAPSRFRPGLSPRLDAFVLRCLSREPADRFRDAREALVAYDELLEPPPRRSRAWLGFAAAGALVVAAVIGARERPASSLASPLQPTERAGGAAAQSAPSAAPAAAQAVTAQAATVESGAALVATGESATAGSATAGSATAGSATAGSATAEAASEGAPNEAALTAAAPLPSRVEAASHEAHARASEMEPAPVREARGSRDRAGNVDDALEREGSSGSRPGRGEAREGETGRGAAPGSAPPSTPRPGAGVAAIAPDGAVPSEAASAPASKPASPRRAERAPGAPAKLRDFE